MEEHKKKLETYQNQLSQVNELLSSDPTNDQFLKLKEDLQEVIKLTEDLIAHQSEPPTSTSNGSALPPPPPPRPPSDGSSMTQNGAAPAVQAPAPAPPPPPAPAPAPPPPPPTTYSAPPATAMAVSPGQRYEILNNGRWYPVAIKAVAGAQATLYYLGHGAEDAVDLRAAELREIPPLPPPPGANPAAGGAGGGGGGGAKGAGGGGLLGAGARGEWARTLGAGAKVVGKYSGDGKLYNATIEEVTDFGYKLVFDQYGNSEEVPLEYMRPRTKNDEKNNESNQEDDAAGQQSKDNEKKFKIPDNLKVLPTDSQAERTRKRLKVKMLKSKFKQKEKSEEAVAKQKNWQSFMTKGKRKTISSKVAMKKDSIFKSPETVDGKVGVIGSDNKMTEYQNKKKFQPSSTADQQI